MLAGCQLTASLSRIIHRTGCGILGRLILSLGSVLKPLIMCDSVKVPGWSQSLPWLTTWYVVYLLAVYWWGHTLYIQRYCDTLSWATPELGSTYLLVRWRLPCQISCSLFIFRFVARKATSSDLLQSSIFIWCSVSVLLLALGGPWSYFTLFHSSSGSWIHSMRLFVFVCLLTWWRWCWKIVHCPRENF